MDKDEKSRIFEFFASERYKLTHYIHSKIQSINDMDAEDMVEDVMLNILNKLAKPGGVNNLSAYVYRSVHNKVVDYLRTEHKIMSLQEFMDEEGIISLSEVLSDGGSSVSDEVERKEFIERLVKAIGKLEPRQRAVFLATEMKGKSFRELAKEWNEPIGTLLSRKCRAVKVLKEMLKDLKSN